MSAADVSLAGLSVADATVPAGGSTTGRATLTGPAPAGGARVTLSVDDPALAVPPSVAVPAGQRSAGFTVVAADVDSLAAVTLSGSYGGATRQAKVVVRPSAALLALWVDPASPVGGEDVTATVGLAGTAPAGGFAVQLTATGGPVVAPASVVVPAGRDASDPFTISTSPVAETTPVQLGATHGRAGVTTTVTLQPPPGLAIVAFTVDGSFPGSSVQLVWTVTLSGPAPAAGALVALAASSAGQDLPGGLPTSILVPAGASSASVSFQTGFDPFFGFECNMTARLGGSSGYAPFCEQGIGPG